MCHFIPKEEQRHSYIQINAKPSQIELKLSVRDLGLRILQAAWGLCNFTSLALPSMIHIGQTGSLPLVVTP